MRFKPYLNLVDVTDGVNSPQGDAQLTPAAESVVADAACSRNIDLQQRALEIQSIVRCSRMHFRT